MNADTQAVQIAPAVVAEIGSRLKRVTDGAATLEAFDTSIAAHRSALPFDEQEAKSFCAVEALQDRDALQRFIFAKAKIEIRKVIIEAAPKERLKLLSPFRAEVDQLSAVMGNAVGGRTTGRSFQNSSLSPGAAAALAAESVEQFLAGNFDDADANALDEKHRREGQWISLR